MGDEAGDGVQFQWESLEPLQDGQTEADKGKWVKTAGKAKVTYSNGDIYEGTFNDAKQKHGRGVYTWSTAPSSNPFVPEGDGFPEGKAPTVRYEGQYVEGKKQGIGKMSFPNGEKYHGMWENNKFHGEGTYYYSSGDIYSGQWNKGVKQGEGTYMYKKDDSQLIGLWEKGSFVSGKWVWKDGTSWHGTFKDGKPLGRGTFFFPNGMQQAGVYQREGDAEDPDAELKTVWKGDTAVDAGADAKELLRSGGAAAGAGSK